MPKVCPVCNESFDGRADKKFCSVYCKSAFQYKNNKDKDAGLFSKIDKQLKLNRRLLKQYNKAGKATVRKEILVNDGFNPKYFTHYWKNYNSEVYFFCYEYGFLSKMENGKEKYVLVTWQSYMN